MKKNRDFSAKFEGHDRYGFPDEMERVTAGKGSDAIVVFGSDKAALVDCGMAYCGEAMMRNLKKAIAKRNKSDGSPYTLDYLFASHTHYDHIGALPYVIREFPDVKVCGSERARYVFTRSGALNVLKSLGESARDMYAEDKNMEIPTEGLRIDITMKDGDSISLGEEKMVALETKGHTDCSMTFVFEPLSVMFGSESTGILEFGDISTPILKNYDDSIKSLEKCRTYGAGHLVVPHYGLIPDDFIDDYWKIYGENAEEKRHLVQKWRKEGLSDEELLEKYTDVYWDKSKQEKQPKEAFMINAINIVKVLGS